MLKSEWREQHICMERGPVTATALHSTLEPDVSDEGMWVGCSSVALRDWIRKNN